MVMLGRINTGYADVHGGFGYGVRNTDGSRILKFADRLGLVICYTCFQSSPLVCRKLHLTCTMLTDSVTNNAMTS